MSLLAEAWNPRPQASTSYAPTHDFWYTKDPSGFLLANADSGLVIGAEGLLACGTVLAALRFLGESFAMTPPSTFIKTADGGREEDPTHFSQILLRNPNKWMSHNRWRNLVVVWLKLWGNSYHEIRDGSRGFATELWPLHPRFMKTVDQRNDGSLVYTWTPPMAPERVLGQERVLHFRDISTDGITGVEIYRLIRNTVGIALMAERHTSTFLRKGARVSALLVPDAPLEKPQREELRESVNEGFGTSSIGVLPHGVKMVPISLNNRESQLVELSDQVVGTILRFLGVPGVVVGWMGDKTSTYQSAKEFFESGGIKHTLLPILANVEAEEEKALLRSDDTRQIKHNIGALLRANFKDRIDGLTKAIGGPFLTVNEGRAIEDRNRKEHPDDPGRYDRPYTPLNMADQDPPPGDTDDDPPPRPPPPPPDDEDEDEEGGEQARAPEHRVKELSKMIVGARAQLLVLVTENAKRVVRRETATLGPKHEKFGGLPGGAKPWRAFVLKFYGEHRLYVAATMRIPEDQARAYCDSQASSVLSEGVAALEGSDPPEQLVAMVMPTDLVVRTGG